MSCVSFTKYFADIAGISVSGYQYWLLSDVDSELKELERSYIKLNAVNYNMEYIVSIQDMIHEEYEKKEKEIGIEFN